MSRKCKIIDAGEGASSERQCPEKTALIDWKLCAICQQDTEEKLDNPSIAKYRGSDKECGYKLFAENILEFHQIDALPEDIDIVKWDSGDSIEATLRTNQAVWHKSCRNRFDKQKLQHVQKKKSKENLEYETSPVKTRQRSVGSMARTCNCFFCEEDDKI